MDIFEWTEQTPVTANNMNEMQNILNNNISEEVLDVYSTTEQRIGTWTNGKPVYQITLYYSNIGASSSKDISNLSIDTVIGFDFICKRTSNGVTHFERTYYNNSNDYFRTYINISAGTLEIRCVNGFTTNDIIGILRYTKTTY